MMRKQATRKIKINLFNQVHGIRMQSEPGNRTTFLSGKRLFMVCMFVVMIALAGCNQQEARTIDIYNASEDKTGTVKLSEKEDGVQAKVKVEGLSSGFHGVHVHEYAHCSGSDFKDAGSHFNPTGEKHGLMNADGAHVGDLPNIEADTDGKLNGEVMIEEATLLDGKNSLLNGKGTSIVITEEADDGMKQPSGDSGKRLMCGTIENESDNKKEEPSDPTKTQ